MPPKRRASRSQRKIGVGDKIRVVSKPVVLYEGLERRSGKERRTNVDGRRIYDRRESADFYYGMRELLPQDIGRTIPKQVFEIVKSYLNDKYQSEVTQNVGEWSLFVDLSDRDIRRVHTKNLKTGDVVSFGLVPGGKILIKTSRRMTERRRNDRRQKNILVRRLNKK